eukprot:scaffold85082_cov40-Cyclotella_meneghiniana.AAC.1
MEIHAMLMHVRCIVACCDDAQRDQLRKIPKQSRWCHDVLEGDDIKIYGVNIAREVDERGCGNIILPAEQHYVGRTCGSVGTE